MWLLKENGQERKSASSWGCELKYHLFQFEPRPCSQPPREAVSWNRVVEQFLPWGYYRQPPREAVSWNTIDLYRICKTTCQPPREAVSWNVYVVQFAAHLPCQPPREAVSWNICRLDSKKEVDVSLLVRLWVEMDNVLTTSPPVPRQPPREAVSWNYFWSHFRGMYAVSASSWGCELK